MQQMFLKNPSKQCPVGLQKTSNNWEKRRKTQETEWAPTPALNCFQLEHCAPFNSRMPFGALGASAFHKRRLPKAACLSGWLWVQLKGLTDCEIYRKYDPNHYDNVETLQNNQKIMPLVTIDEKSEFPESLMISYTAYTCGRSMDSQWLPSWATTTKLQTLLLLRLLLRLLRIPALSTGKP